MSAQNTGVSVYRVYRGDTPIHFQKLDTPCDTGADTPSLKALAGKYLSEGKPIRPAIQSPIHQEKKCIGGISGADTLLEAAKRAPDEADDNPWITYWRSICPDYWQGCFTCPDFAIGQPEFCRRHPYPELAGVAQ